MNIKQDSGKRQWSLLPWGPLRHVVDVFRHGADKYEVDNWKHRRTATDVRYFDAALRHLLAWRDGERPDPESGLPHLAHAVCCLLIILWHDDDSAGG